MTTPSLDLKLTPRFSGILGGHASTLDILVQVQGSDRPENPNPRPALNLAMVLDRSGSMGGQPLREAVRCILRMIDRLGPRDRAAIIAYDHEVQTLVSSREVTDKSVFREALADMYSGGSTDLHGGWLAGAGEIVPHVRPDTVSRILLLSDGQANRGETNPDVIASACAGFAARSVSTSTYGLGRHFNEDLMDAMARSGHGKPYYGETADDLMEPFEREFDLFDALCARSVRLSLDLAEGVQAEVTNAYVRDGDSWVLPDVAYEGEAWALVRLTLAAPATGSGQGERVNLGRIRVTANDIEGKPIEVSGLELALPSLPAAAFGVLVADELVSRRAGEISAANLQEAARSAARQRDWRQVRRILEKARQEAANNPWVEAIVGTLQKLADLEDTERFSKEARYSSSELRRRQVSRMEIADDTMDFLQPSFLRRKREQGKSDT